MQAPNDKDAYSRERYKARRSSYTTTRPASKYDEARRRSHPVSHERDAAVASDHAQQASHAQASDRAGSHAFDASEKSRYDRARYANRNGSSASYSLSNGNVAALTHKGSKKPLIITLVVIVALLVVAWILFFPKTFEVTVNGQKTTVSFLTTLQDLVNDGYASPKRGNLIAVDGTVAAVGEGEVLFATINDAETSDPNARLSKDAVVTISDGRDVEEEYTEVIEKLPFSKSTQQITSASYYQGPIHILSSGVDGSQAIRTGAVSEKTASVVLEQPVDAGYTVYTPAVGDDKVIALTFDDGPWPTTTKQILDILKQNDAHATFFTVGEQCKDNATVLKELVANGNQVATHSYDHANGSGRGVDMTLMSPSEQIKEITDGFQAIEDVIGKPVSRIMRAPGGNYHGDLVSNLAPYVTAEIGWNVDSRDWTKPGVDAIVKQLLTVEPGQVILMHDGGGDRSQSVEALRQALPILKSRGYRFVTIDELLEYGMPQ